MTARRPVRILCDLSGILPGGKGGGIKPALLTMLGWLAERAGSEMAFVYVTNAETREEVARLARPADQIIGDEETGPTVAARHGCDVVYCPLGITDRACPGIPTVTLVVDLLHRDFPSTLPEPDRIYREQKFAEAVEVTDAFQVISWFTHGRLSKHYQIPQDRIFRTYLPIHTRLHGPGLQPAARPPNLRLPGPGYLFSPPTMAARRPAGLTGPYFFYPAKFWAHKNHANLLRAYSIYEQEAGGDAWPLVLSGFTDQQRLAIVRQVAEQLGITGQVHFLGYVPEPELAGLLASAGALVFPSLYEGFGIPLLEAMAFGVPIVASDAASIPEIVGKTALLVDAANANALASALSRIAADGPLRAELVQRGRNRLAHFSADQEFEVLRGKFLELAHTPARRQRRGFTALDGLVESTAVFGLPANHEMLELLIRTRPLGVGRTAIITCGEETLLRQAVSATVSIEVHVFFRPASRALVIEVPDAGSLSASDPRVHGLLLESLRARPPGGQWFDLLADNPPAPAVRDHTAKELGQAVARSEPSHSPNFEPTQRRWYLDSQLPHESEDGFIEVRGWCTGIGREPARLRLQVAGIEWVCTANMLRPDVQEAHPDMASAACGFSARLRVGAGRHELVLEAVDEPTKPFLLLRHPLSVPALAPLRRCWWTESPRLLTFQFLAGPSTPKRALSNRARLGPKPQGNWPRFSIVTPSYQQARFLRQTMLSVLCQGVNGDYVVQDGGSQDGSVEIIRHVASYHDSPPAAGPAIRLADWQSTPDRGQSDAIVRGFAKTSGDPDDVMAWINSDDLYLPGSLAIVADYFARHPEVDAVYSHRLLMDEESNEIGRWFLPEHDPAVLRLNDFVPQETLFWRRRIWDKVGGIDTSLQFAMDWDLLLRFQAAGAQIVRLPHFLACFRLHSAQKTSAEMHRIGQREIDMLRTKVHGRFIAPEDLETNGRLARYLRRSALLELLWNLGLYRC